MKLTIACLRPIFIWMAGAIPGEKATGIRGLSLFPFSAPDRPVKRLWHHRLLLKKTLILHIEEQAPVPFFFCAASLR